MKKAFILIFILFALVLSWKLLSPKERPVSQEPFVAVTNFPLYEIATKLLGDEVKVEKLIPFGVESHTYRPSVKTMALITKAELFIYSGLGMEPWINRTYANGLDMSQFVKLRAIEEEHEGHEAHEGHSHHGKDPHYWLNIDNMIDMTFLLSQKFQAHFPKSKQKIETNAKTYIEALKALKKSYDERLKSCQRREIVVNHNAFAYLGEQYDFRSFCITGLSPDEQASAKKMTEIANLVKKEKIPVVFFESFVSDKVALTIAKETNTQVQSLQPLANVTQEEAKKGYIKLMEENLAKLAKAMSCQ